MDNAQRGRQIRASILRDVPHHPADIAKHTAKAFDITPQAVYSHLKKLENDKLLTSHGKGKGKQYFLGTVRKYDSLFQITDSFTEDRVWTEHFSYLLLVASKNYALLVQGL